MFWRYPWSPDLADMQLIRKYNKGVRSLLCNIETCRKYLWVALLKDKNVLKSLIIFKNFWMSLIVSQKSMGRLV